MSAHLATGGAMKFPLAVIDFEACALDQESYPIEVGYAIVLAPEEPFKTWSTLIQPAPEWLNSCGWDTDAERIHGISQRDLRKGMTVREAAEAMNQALAPLVHVWCDGGHYDALWLRVLFEAAGLQPAFILHNLSDLLTSVSARER